KEGLIVEVEDVMITADDKFYPVGTVTNQDPKSSNKKVLEGETVKIYVCKGYKFDVDIDLPDDFVTETYYVTLWAGGKMFNEGSKVNSSELRTYKFKDLTTDSEKLDLKVKISADGTDEQNLYDIVVDNKDGRVRIVKEYDDYDKYQEPESSQPTSSDELTNSQNNNSNSSNQSSATSDLDPDENPEDGTQTDNPENEIPDDNQNTATELEDNTTDIGTQAQ
ncbi:MAG: hypothetical protein II234_03005, partial [Clostridia bacterium]|nr:hypothetical protein [Clostridia bacterium]